MLKFFTYCESDEFKGGHEDGEESTAGYHNEDLMAALSRARKFMNVDKSDYQCFSSDKDSNKCTSTKCLIIG